MKYYYLILIPIVLFACEKTKQPAQEELNANPLLGAWEMKEINWKRVDTTFSIKKAQPGIFIMSSNRYSIIWTPIDKPRTPFQVLSNPTDDELKSGFRSIVFNAGSYVLTDSTITTTAFVAKVPGFEGGKQFYKYELEGDLLKLTMYDETYPDGTKPEWFGRYVTEFILSRAE